MASDGELAKQVHIQGGNEEQQELQKLGPLIVRFPTPVPQVEPIKLVYEEEGGESKSRNMVQVKFLSVYTRHELECVAAEHPWR